MRVRVGGGHVPPSSVGAIQGGIPWRSDFSEIDIQSHVQNDQQSAKMGVLGDHRNRLQDSLNSL